MRNNIAIIALFILVVMGMLGCAGSYNSIIKSRDPELMYSKALEYYEAKKYSRTIRLLEETSHYFSGTRRDDTVAYYLAAAYYRSKDLATSAMLLDDFRKTFTLSPFLEDVEYMYARGFYFMSGEPNRDQTATIQALVAIDEYVERYPNSVKIESMRQSEKELTEKLHDKAYINAKSYYTTGRYKAAALALKNALNRYPTSGHREEIMYLIAKSNYLLAENSLSTLQRDRYLNMMDSFYSFISEYPESKYAKELGDMQENAKTFTAQFTDLESIQNNREETYDGDQENLYP